ncbi:MAG TPA: histidine kinase [Coriobacteriia bacterium]
MGTIRDAALRVFESARDRTAAPDVSGRRPVSHLSLFRVLLGLRWAILLTLPIQEGVSTGPAGNYVVWAAIAVAAVYTLGLTVFSKRVLALHMRGPLFAILDMAVAFGLYSTGQGTSWPFFLFSTTTILFAGLYGTAGAGILAAVAWNVLTVLAQWMRGVPLHLVFGITAMEDLFNLCMIGALWAYSIGLAMRLNVAYDDLTRNRDALALANRGLDDREKQILGLLDVGEALLRRHDAEDIVRIVAGALDGMGFGPVRVWVVEDGQLRTLRPGADPFAVSPDDGGPLVDAVRSREVVIVEPGSDRAVPGVDPGKLAVVVPIVAEEETLGALVVQSVSGFFNAVDLEIVGLFAEQAALGLQHLRFQQKGRELAVAEERNRITREIHDSVVQKIFGASLLTAALRKIERPADVSEGLRQLDERIAASLTDLRFAVLDWDSLEWSGTLRERAERYIAEFIALSGVPVTFGVTEGEPGPSASTAEHVLRILQGALSDAWRRACASSVAVELAFDAEGVSMTVTDDGEDQDPAEPTDRSARRLDSITPRGARFGGVVTVETLPGGGTRISARMPR